MSDLNWRTALLAMAIYMIVMFIGGILFEIRPDMSEALLVVFATLLADQFVRIADSK
jgi:uncharacterized membrane protein YfcA